MLQSIFNVFSEISSWIVDTLPVVTGLFWTGSGLTFMGVLAICGLGFSVIFLLIGVIQNFLHFRG